MGRCDVSKSIAPEGAPTRVEGWAIAGCGSQPVFWMPAEMPLTVVISARSGTLSVKMPGEALSDGGLSEQIRVKNLNSKRVIRARVTAPGQVEVAL